MFSPTTSLPFPHYSTSLPKLALPRGPEFGNSTPCPISCYVQEYASNPYVSRSTDMGESDRALTVRSRHNVLRHFDVGPWVKRWLRCRENRMSVSCHVVSEVDCPFLRSYEEVEHEKNLSTLVQLFDGHSLPKTGPSFVVLHHPFTHLYFGERFYYSGRDCLFEPHLRRQEQNVFAWRHNAELFAISSSHRPNQYI